MPLGSSPASMRSPLRRPRVSFCPVYLPRSKDSELKIMSDPFDDASGTGAACLANALTRPYFASSQPVRLTPPPLRPSTARRAMAHAVRASHVDYMSAIEAAHATGAARHRMGLALRAVPVNYMSAIDAAQAGGCGGANARGQTLLHAAARDDAVDAAGLALARGTPPTGRDLAGVAPLRACVSSRGPSLRVARLLLRVRAVRASVGDRACDGMAAIHAAAFFGFAEMVRLLVVEGGADVDEVDASGSTPLHIAAALPLRRAAVLRMLVDCGANLRRVDRTGFTPPDVALVSGHDENYTALVRAQAL